VQRPRDAAAGDLALAGAVGVDQCLGSAITLGVLCTGIAYAFLFRLLDRIGATRTATVTYLVPLFGVAWAWAVLGETPTLSMLIAGLLILGGVALSQSRRPPPVLEKQA
jgi:drug/metabolite transporter (DMT)-like permease